MREETATDEPGALVVLAFLVLSDKGSAAAVDVPGSPGWSEGSTVIVPGEIIVLGPVGTVTVAGPGAVPELLSSGPADHEALALTVLNGRALLDPVGAVTVMDPGAVPELPSSVPTDRERLAVTEPSEDPWSEGKPVRIRDDSGVAGRVIPTVPGVVSGDAAVTVTRSGVNEKGGSTVTVTGGADDAAGPIELSFMYGGLEEV